MEAGVWIAIIFGGIPILGGLFARLTSGIRSVALFVGAGLILVGAFGPDKIKDFSIGKDGVHVSRFQPSEDQRERTKKYAQDSPLLKL